MCRWDNIIAFRAVASIEGLDFAHLTSAPGPGSSIIFCPFALIYVPPDALNCLATTYLPPAVPRNLIKDDMADILKIS